MKEFQFGTYIKKRRKEMGMSQEALCEGLCSVSTLSRLENNQQTPSRSLARQILERLGLPKNRFIALWDQESISADALVREIRGDMIEYRRLRRELRPEFCEKIREKLDELESIASLEDKSVQQFLLSHRALLGGQNGAYNLTEKLSMQLEAIRLTCPKFDPEDFQHGHYNMEESMLINQIAQTYSKIGKRKRSIDIYYQLIRYIEKNYKELSGYTGCFCLTAHNYACDLALEKRYLDAIEIAEKGRKICLRYRDFQFLAGFLAIQAECLFFLGEIEESTKLYRRAYYTYAAFEDKINLEIIRKEIKTHLHIELPD